MDQDAADERHRRDQQPAKKEAEGEKDPGLPALPAIKGSARTDDRSTARGSVQTAIAARDGGILPETTLEVKSSEKERDPACPSDASSAVAREVITDEYHQEVRENGARAIKNIEARIKYQ